MPKIDRLKEEIAALKLFFTAFLAIDVSLIAWLAQNFQKAQTATPSVLTVEAEKSVAEIVRMLSTLYIEVMPDGKIPSAWADLPKLTTLQKSNRVHCRGVPCSGVRVYQDQPEALWLTFVPNMWSAGRLPDDIGSAMVSLDSNAANWETNV